MEANNRPLVKVENLKKYFPLQGNIFSPVKGHVHAVDGLDFTIMPGKSMGLVGESGCGKTTTGKLLVRLYEPTSGNVYIQNAQGELEDIAHRRGKQLKTFRRNVQMIFQDPYESGSVLCRSGRSAWRTCWTS